MKKSTIWVFFALCLTLSGELNQSRMPDFARAKALYYVAVDGNRHAEATSTTMFEDLHRDHAGEAQIAAYLGSLRLMGSSRTLAIWRKGKLAREGLTLLDRAVEMRPDDLEVRFVRAATTYHLPSIFNRGDQCLSDLAVITERVENAVRAKQLEPRIGTTALLYYGKLLEKKSRAGDAQKVWRRAASLAPETSAATEARQKLIR